MVLLADNCDASGSNCQIPPYPIGLPTCGLGSDVREVNAQLNWGWRVCANRHSCVVLTGSLLVFIFAFSKVLTCSVRSGSKIGTLRARPINTSVCSHITIIQPMFEQHTESCKDAFCSFQFQKALAASLPHSNIFWIVCHLQQRRLGR